MLHVVQVHVQCNIDLPVTVRVHVAPARPWDEGDYFQIMLDLITRHIPYSRKIWRELNLAKSPKTAKIKYCRNLNLAIAYGEGYDVISN